MKAENLDIELLVQNYVLGRMTGIEIDEFEEYFLSKPDVIEMIEIAQTIHIGLQGSAVSLGSGAAKFGHVGIRERIKSWFYIPVPAGALAACFVLSIAVSLFQSERQLTPEDVFIASFSTQVARGHSSNSTVDLHNPNGKSALFIKVKRADYASYILKVSDAKTSKEQWASAPFSLSSLRDKFIPLPDHAAIDNANVSVFGISDTGEELSVPFCHYSEVCN